MSNLNDFLREDVEDKVFTETVRYLQEANKVKFDKKTMRKRLFTQATLYAAREAGDPLYVKYQKASAQKRKFRREIQVKFASKGKAKLREYDKRRKSKAPKA